METSNAVASLFRFSDDTENFAAGTVIFREGDPGECMFVVRSGQIAISVAGSAVLTVGPGGVIGELALVDTGLRSATATATVDTELVRVDARKFQFLIQQHPFFGLEVMKVMAGRLREMNERLRPS